MIKTNGIHHISSMVGHAQRNVDFYAGVLGYRMVKKTLNYDDKSMYHLYFGNREADSGLVTTFPMLDANEGVVGGGQVGSASYGIRLKSMEFWKNRLESFGIEVFETVAFNKKRLSFKDLDGLEIQLIETKLGKENSWEFNGVNKDNALLGIERALIHSRKPEETLKLFTDILGYTLVDQDSETYLLQVNDEFGGTLELAKASPKMGVMGVGTVHHIAFVINDDEIEEWKIKLQKNGFLPTKIKDRKYFKSLYFRETGGLLIELATKSPGMTIDEDLNSLGEELIIPDHYENADHSHLMPLFVREVSELVGYGYRDSYEYEILQRKHEIMEEIKSIKAKGDLSEKDTLKIQQLKAKYLKKERH